MATHTTYYNLTKPAQNDKVNIGVLNDNADIIDTALHNKVDSDDLTADNVMMSDGVTSVEDALDGLQIKKTTVTGTTDSNGVIESNLSRSSKLILSAYSTSSIQNLIQVGFNSSGNYIFRFTNNTGAARSNVSFSRESPMIIYYIEVASS